MYAQLPQALRLPAERVHAPVAGGSRKRERQLLQLREPCPGLLNSSIKELLSFNFTWLSYAMFTFFCISKKGWTGFLFASKITLSFKKEIVVPTNLNGKMLLLRLSWQRYIYLLYTVLVDSEVKKQLIRGDNCSFVNKKGYRSNYNTHWCSSKRREILTWYSLTLKFKFLYSIWQNFSKCNPERTSIRY